MLLVGEGGHIRVMMTLSAWTPTPALVVLFKKLDPESTIKEFYKNAFRERLNVKMMLCVTVVQIAAVAGAAGFVAFTDETSFLRLFDVSAQAIAMGAVMAFITGATGE